jgi:hypothetical protein
MWMPSPVSPPLLDEQPPDIDSAPMPACVNMSSSTPEARLKQLLRFVAAEIRARILAQPNQAMEYGSIIFRQSNGEIGYTSLQNSPDFRTKIAWNELPNSDYTKVLGIIHSHPRYLPDSTGALVDYYDPLLPDRLLRPSNDYAFNGQMIGDWITTDAIISNGAPNTLSIFITGFNGTNLGLNEYSNADNRTTTTKNPVSLDTLPPCETSS